MLLYTGHNVTLYWSQQNITLATMLHHFGHNSTLHWPQCYIILATTAHYNDPMLITLATVLHHIGHKCNITLATIVQYTGPMLHHFGHKSKLQCIGQMLHHTGHNVTTFNSCFLYHIAVSVTSAHRIYHKSKSC